MLNKIHIKTNRATHFEIKNKLLEIRSIAYSDRVLLRLVRAQVLCPKYVLSDA